MPFRPREQVIERIQLVRRYTAFGLSPKEIQEYLIDNFGIDVTVQQIYQDLKDIREGKHDTYLDNLLDLHYPSIYEGVLTNINEDLDKIKEMSERNEIDDKLRLKAIVYHGRLSVELLNTLHKGAVVRAMKQLSTKAKILVREVMQQDSMIRRGVSLPSFTENKNLPRRVITLDENMKVISEEWETENET